MIKKIIIKRLTFLIIVYLIANIAPGAYSTQDYLRPLATGLNQPSPYHPDNILATFLGEKFSWESIPDKYLEADIKVLVEKLAGLLDNKKIGKLNTPDFNKRVFTMKSGEKKGLSGLFGFIMKRYGLLAPADAVSEIRRILGLKEDKITRYFPENILATFLKGKLSWESIPDEYLEADIEVMVKELARLLDDKEIGELTEVDFKDPVFTMRSGKKKGTGGLLAFIMRRYRLSGPKDAVSIMKGILEKRARSRIEADGPNDVAVKILPGALKFIQAIGTAA